MRGMKLSEYMKTHKLSDADMASLIGCSEGAVKKWRYDERTPRRNQLLRICAITDGAVTPNDFLRTATPEAA